MLVESNELTTIKIIADCTTQALNKVIARKWPAVCLFFLDDLNTNDLFRGKLIEIVMAVERMLAITGLKSSTFANMAKSDTSIDVFTLPINRNLKKLRCLLMKAVAFDKLAFSNIEKIFAIATFY